MSEELRKKAKVPSLPVTASATGKLSFAEEGMNSFGKSTSSNLSIVYAHNTNVYRTPKL
ncbi:MAG TPA: hypothetical protein VMW24_25385 [Sedimentisphaerales bacterium]|nr:hypothetical protein [Sedimentisphaerales bacterium]